MRKANRIQFINIKRTLRAWAEWIMHFNGLNGLACDFWDWIGTAQQMTTAFNFDVP
jgi:hypothetical protein